jgi:hypothetical protein
LAISPTQSFLMPPGVPFLKIGLSRLGCELSRSVAADHVQLQIWPFASLTSWSLSESQKLQMSCQTGGI